MRNTGRALIEAGLKRGLTVEFDYDPKMKYRTLGEAWNAAKACDDVGVTFRTVDGKYAGWALLIHSNGPEECLSDYGVGNPGSRSEWVDGAVSDIYDSEG